MKVRYRDLDKEYKQERRQLRGWGFGWNRGNGFHFHFGAHVWNIRK